MFHLYFYLLTCFLKYSTIIPSAPKEPNTEYTQEEYTRESTADPLPYTPEQKDESKDKRVADISFENQVIHQNYSVDK